jgi:hypothetical protein
MRPTGWASTVAISLLVACPECDSTTGSVQCQDAIVTITSPPDGAVFAVYQQFTRSSTFTPDECTWSDLVWTVDGAPIVTIPLEIAPGNTQIQVSYSNGSQVLGTDVVNIAIVLGHELVYDVNESAIWRTDGVANAQVTVGGNPAWSAAAAKVAFVRSDGNDDEIWVVALSAGATPVQVTDNTTHDYAPAWSPDGQRLAYVGEEAGNPELYIQQAVPGAQRTRLTTNTHEDLEPDWKGNLIAYQANPNNEDFEIFTIRDDLTQAAQPLTSNQLDDIDPHWSPADSRIVFSRESPVAHDVWIMDADGGNPRNLTTNAAHDREAEISPDGVLYAFVSDRTGAQRLWVAKVDDPNADPLMVRVAPSGSGHPRWKP